MASILLFAKVATKVCYGSFVSVNGTDGKETFAAAEKSDQQSFKANLSPLIRQSKRGANTQRIAPAIGF
ncbi:MULTISPECIES: hypothetical protein [unclassified Falsihalocynthiibacter]|uniref:hypothetical protein n=1 Tax=unclassified Falsihalocynthiibacter TaxID=2854191 RepID=UPI00350FE346